MTMEQYLSLIIHSKLLNAYNTATSLALTWNASISKIENELLNDDICGMFINGLLIVVFFYLGVKADYKMAIGPLCDVRIAY